MKYISYLAELITIIKEIIAVLFRVKKYGSVKIFV